MTTKTEKWGMSPARIEPDTRTYSGRFAAKLRGLREKVELLPEDVAEQMGVGLTTIYSWERGDTFPKPEQLLLLSNVLGLKSVKTLFPDR